jgi:hypothetical protein
MTNRDLLQERNACRGLGLDFEFDARFFEKVPEGIVTVFPGTEKPCVFLSN